MSYSTVKRVPVFLNMDILNPIGTCQLIITEDEDDNELFYAFLMLNQPVDQSLYFYYLREATDMECFKFIGINLSEKKMRHVYPRGRVLRMMYYRPAIHRNPKKIEDMILGRRL